MNPKILLIAVSLAIFVVIEVWVCVFYFMPSWHLRHNTTFAIYPYHMPQCGITTKTGSQGCNRTWDSGSLSRFHREHFPGEDSCLQPHNGFSQ